MSENKDMAPSDAMILGELRGQMREVVHSMNNLSMKFDGLSREVIALGALASDVGQLKADVEMLKAERNRRGGAEGVLAALVKSPAIGWLAGVAIAAYAYLTGKAA